ncbi:UNVERIFIED_CONTAM: hypothetical protein GTU68_016955 [Idotea baltica]|nr:hypothetical protein [Idotea baltica]
MAHIITVPAFSDNYIWLICDDNKEKAVIVDPGDPRQLIEILKNENIEPVAIILTHFHYDHGNGIPSLLEIYPNLKIYGPESECVKAIDYPLQGHEEIFIEEINTHFQVMNVPGHTSGHIAYYTESGGQKRLFCGDTIFAGGCGRVFNGSKKLLHDSLAKIADLPEDTLLYCTHEYTTDNLGFAKWVEPDSAELSARIKETQNSRDNKQATVPSLLSLEKSTNPFLRTHLDHVTKKVAEATGKTLNNSTEVFAAMRTWKDTEYD